MENKNFRKILVANRGEIALRVLRTCKRLGFATVAVYSDADARAPHVRFADEAVRIGPPAALESYLDPNRILAAAWATGAEAIHPGYGFLSENADFAEACAGAGLQFIGPPASAIRAMGSKSASRRLMAERGVPVTPGYDGEDQSDATLRAHLLEIGFPVVVKASTGGGGKGMVVVRSEAEILPALQQARRLAKSSFGDDTLLLERYVSPVRHVEVQILGDHHGNLLHVFERECSIQRRHQKIVEETPSPALNPQLREEMGWAAVLSGQAVGYHSAGTVEFLLDPEGRFYFLEMNTRLQVEHPVTEMVTGLDLVEQQIRVAQGQRLGFTQQDLRQRGHAIECRLYAEDPAKEFLPCTGTVLDWQVPAIEGLRVDAGVEPGTEVGIDYDPMLAKLVMHADDRPAALRKMARALELLSVQGLTTNREFLIRILRHPEFEAGRLSTHFIAEHLPPEARIEETPADRLVLACLAAAFHAHQQRRAALRILPQIPSGWRNSPFRDQDVSFKVGDSVHRLDYRAQSDDRFSVRLDGGDLREVRLFMEEEPRLGLELDGVRRTLRVVRHGNTIHVHGPLGALTLEELPRFPEAGGAEAEGSCISPMPGKIRKVLVQAGQDVAAGSALVVLEAMKMEHTVSAPRDGTVEEVLVTEGQQVQAEALLLRFTVGKGKNDAVEGR